MSMRNYGNEVSTNFNFNYRKRKLNDALTVCYLFRYKCEIREDELNSIGKYLLWCVRECCVRRREKNVHPHQQYIPIQVQRKFAKDL